MVEKPTSGDSEQRAWQTRVAREQSGLPPEEETQEARPDESEPRPVSQERPEGAGRTPEP